MDAIRINNSTYVCIYRQNKGINMTTLIEKEVITSKIIEARGVRVILDSDLAGLYQVETKYLIRQYKRNIDRFPSNFAFQLTKEEYLRCQNVTSKTGSGGRRYLPYVFTEHGTLMVSSVLKNDRAIKINQSIINAFIELRSQIMLNPSYILLKEKLTAIESRISSIEDNQKIESLMTSTKVIKLSQEVKSIKDILDDFQNIHVIIKRPDSQNEDAYN